MRNCNVITLAVPNLLGLVRNRWIRTLGWPCIRPTPSHQSEPIFASYPAVRWVVASVHQLNLVQVFLLCFCCHRIGVVALQNQHTSAKFQLHRPYASDCAGVPRVGVKKNARGISAAPWIVPLTPCWIACSTCLAALIILIDQMGKFSW